MNPERLAYWYFRLNGFLTIEDFVVHPDIGNQQRTDVDMLATRFLHRRENQVHPMEDDSRVANCDTLANIILAEIKTSQCGLNDSWTNPSKENVQRMLRAVGCIPRDRIEEAATAIYETGTWSDADATIRIFAIGEFRNPYLRIPSSQQLTWDEIINFCIQRFQTYQLQKSSLGLWSGDGRELKRIAGSSSPDHTAIRRLFKLHDLSNVSQGTQP